MERKSRREINKTKREEGWEGVQEEDEGEAALDYMGAGNRPHNHDGVSDLLGCLASRRRGRERKSARNKSQIDGQKEK